MGLTFQQKFYSIGDEVFVVYGKNNKIIAMCEVRDDKIDVKIEEALSKYGRVDRLNFDDVILKGYKILEENKIEW